MTYQAQYRWLPLKQLTLFPMLYMGYSSPSVIALVYNFTYIYIELYKENYFLKLIFLLNHLWKFDQTQQEWFLVAYQNCWNGSDWLLERMFKLCT